MIRDIVSFPDHAAMVEQRGGAYILNFKELDPQPQDVTVGTGFVPQALVRPFDAFALTTKSNVCEAILLQSVAFRIISPVTLTIGDLKPTRFSLTIDSKTLVLDKAFPDHLEFGAPMPNAGLDFSDLKLPLLANRVDGDGALADSTFGYFIPNNSIIVVEVRNFPAGHGKVEIKTSLVAATYSTEVCSVRRP